MAWNGLAILNALAGGPKLTRQIAASVEAPSASINPCLVMLRRRKLIATAEGVHQITDAGKAALEAGADITSGPCDGNVLTRTRGNLRARAWRLMRIRDAFGLDDLLSTLCDGTESEAAGNLRGYVRALVVAGYLAPMRKGAGGKPRWRLKASRDTGPEAPAWNKKTRVLRDHNSREVFDIPRERRADHA